jgi:phosphodiesterase/alkaline phosphatase D-like protein
LTSSTSYDFRVAAVNAAGAGAFAPSTNIVTVTAAPVGAAATDITSTSFTANWNSVATATKYRLDVSTDVNFGSGTFVSGFEDLDAGVATSTSVTGLTAGVTYYYRLRAENSSGTSSSSTAITVTTLAAPVATAATTITTAGFTATWTAYSGATSYELDVATDPLFGSLVSGFNPFVVAGGGTTSQVVGSLTAGTTYYYRVRAILAGPVTTENSNAITVVTVADAPTAPTSSALTATGFTAQWTAPAGQVDSYRIDVSTDVAFGSFVPGYEDLSVSATSKAITGLNSGTTYYFRVRAVNAGGVGADVVSSAIETIPAAPSALSASNVAAGSFTAHWAVSVGATAYELEVSTDPGFGTLETGFDPLVISDGSTVSASVSGLSTGTYYYRLRATSAAGTSSNSNVVTVNVP